MKRLLIALAGTIALSSAAFGQTAARVDFDGSGTVDFADFVAFAKTFGTTSVTHDVSGNGTVDFTDFVSFAERFGQTVTKQSQPDAIAGSITTNRVLTADRPYLLSGAVFVQNGATLVAMPGVTVYGEGATNGTLVIAQGGKIVADGTAAHPIVFTSDQPSGSRDRGQWGGLIINGRAPLNTGATAIGEGDTGTYGGTDAADSSGVLRYVRVEFAGIEFSLDNELNGIAFQGVGSGTMVDYIQVHFNQDDGIEFFGGTVNAKHLYCTGIRDDSFDWTDGWTGKGQFWIAQQRGDDADNGFEADNNADNNEALPRSNPTIYNVTLVGDPDGPESDTGLLLREGTGATLRNFIVTGFNLSALDVDQASTHSQASSGGLSLESTLFHNNKVGGATTGTAGSFDLDADGFDEGAWALSAGKNNSESDPLLRAPYSRTSPDFAPMSGSPARGGVTVAQPPMDGFFDAVSFIGGMDPDANWIAGWTTTEQPARGSQRPLKGSHPSTALSAGQAPDAENTEGEPFGTWRAGIGEAGACPFL